jgi:GNAT superfamily N-acetyltransferase
MFAGIELAARIERAESKMVAEAAASVSGRRPEQAVWVHELAGGVASVMAGPSPLNKVAGLGFDGVPPTEALEEVEAAFGERGIPVQVELSSLADPDLARTLTRRGYELVGFEDVLGLDLRAYAPGPIPDEIEIEACDADALERWLDVVVTGFAHPDDQGVASHESFDSEVLRAIIRDMAGGEGFTRLLARRDGQPAGAGSMRIDCAVALLTGAATLPEHRRRGVQTALLHTRLGQARDAGCEVAVVTTSPGSKSQENVQRRGFALLYTRAVLVLDATAAG